MKGVVCMSSLVSSLTFTSPAEIPHPRLSAQNRQQTGSILTSTTPSSGSDLKNWLSRQLCRLIHSCLPVSHSPRRGRDLVPNLVSCLRIPLIHLLRTRSLQYPYRCATILLCAPPSRLFDSSQIISSRRRSAPFSRTSASHSQLVSQ